MLGHPVPCTTDPQMPLSLAFSLHLAKPELSERFRSRKFLAVPLDQVLPRKSQAGTTGCCLPLQISLTSLVGIVAS